MPKREIEFFIVDILIAIDTIRRYSVSLKTSDDLMKDEALCIIITRQLEIIGEAMKYLLGSSKLAKLTKPEWRRIVDFRNVVAHEYFGVSYDEVFYIIQKKIPTLEREIKALTERLSDKELFLQVLEDALQDLERLNRFESIEYLNKIKNNFSI